MKPTLIEWVVKWIKLLNFPMSRNQTSKNIFVFLITEKALFFSYRKNTTMICKGRDNMSYGTREMNLFFVPKP
ncbi:hypothetical protein C7K70_15320 [Aeromonas hydrophila]|nr:hypothetical protein C7K70_15320 [Aeromonas hydrophila]